MVYSFFLRERKLKELKNLFSASMIKSYFIQIRNLKQALTHWLVLKNVHSVIKFNQKAWFKPFINMNTELRKKWRKWFQKSFVKVDK